MRRMLLGGALAVAAALALSSGPSHGSAAVAATPTPVALQYDEITRTIIPPATPPAPGEFQTEYAAIANATPTPEPPKGMGSFLSHAMGGAMDKLAMLRAGTLTRLTYYKGWLRTEYPVQQTATISKCAEHQFISLDLAKKTYTLTNTQPACPTKVQMPMSQGGNTTVNEAPGTADMTVTSTSSALGPLTIDAIPTVGYDNAMSMSSTNATGSCSTMNVKMQMERYVSKIGIPRIYCPLPRSSAMENPGSMVVHGGCKPTMHLSGSPQAMAELNTLVMYSKMTFGGGDSGNQHGMAGMAMLVERGNVKWLSGAPADALFTVPPGFTQAQ